MNRRHFIHTVMLGAGAASTAGAWPWKKGRETVGRTYKHQPKRPLKLKLSPAEQEIAAKLKTGSKTLYLFGGPVLARAAGTDAAWCNFLSDARDFPRVKRRLFEFGVEPVSTPEMPGSFIKFAHKGQIFNVMNCEIEEFCQLNRLNAEIQLVPFAHNFLIYDLQRQEAADPFGALARQGDKLKPEIQLVSKPRTILQGFDCVLSGRFESKLLGLTPSAEFREFEEFVLNQECSPEDTPRIVERAVNYLPDAIEILGADAAEDIATSRLVSKAARTGLEVEMKTVWSGLKQHEREDQPTAFIALMKEEMGLEQSASGFEDDLTMYLAKNGFAIRRNDLTAQAVLNA